MFTAKQIEEIKNECDPADLSIEELHTLCDMALAVHSESGPSEVERLKEALRQVKAWVVGEKSPNWYDDTTDYLTRGKIADICDIALAHPHHPRDMHLTVEKR